jgi:hypothetical protein
LTACGQECSPTNGSARLVWGCGSRMKYVNESLHETAFIVADSCKRLSAELKNKQLTKCTYRHNRDKAFITEGWEIKNELFNLHYMPSFKKILLKNFL